MRNGRGDQLVDDPAALRERVHALWAERRFIGFDSFEGMPEPTGVDRERMIGKPGTFEIAPEECFRRVEGAGVTGEAFLVNHATKRTEWRDALTEMLE